MTEWIERLNPLSYTSSESYTAFWQLMFSTVLSGFWGRFFAFLFFVLSFWFGVRRRNVLVSGGFFALSLSVTFGAPLLKRIGLL